MKGARVERPHERGPRIRTDSRLETLETCVRTSRIFSDTISIGICRRRGLLRHLEGGALAAPQRTLAGLPVLAVVRHLTPRPRFTWQRACIVITVRSQDLHDWHSMRTTVFSDFARRDWRRPHPVIARSAPAGACHRAGPPGPAFGRPDDRLRPGPLGRPAWMKRVDSHRNLMVRRTMGRAALLRDARRRARSSRDNGEAVTRG